MKNSKTANLTEIVNYNILISYFFNGLSLIIGFVSVPLFIELLTDNQYGIWITIFSTLSWLTLLDLGLGQGLRNKFPEALLKGHKRKAKNYIEIVYFLTVLISLIFFITTLSITYFFDFNIIFNINPEFPEDINILFILMVFIFCFQFVGNNINGLLYSVQKSRFLVFIDFTSKFLSLMCLLILLTYKVNSLYWLAIITMGSRLLLTIIFTIYFRNFLKRDHQITFSVFSVNKLKQKFSIIKDDKLILLSSRFFIITISSIFLISSTNFLINYFFSAADVIPFSISFKLFSTLLFLFYIFLAPYWSAFTESYAKKDYSWILVSFKKMLIGYALFALSALVVFILSAEIYNLWLSNKVIISTQLNFAVFIYILIVGWNALFAHFLNGVNELRVQFKIAVIHIFTNIPICIIFAIYFDFGIVGLIWGSNLNLLILSIFLPYQSFKIIQGLKK